MIQANAYFIDVYESCSLLVVIIQFFSLHVSHLCRRLHSIESRKFMRFVVNRAYVKIESHTFEQHFYIKHFKTDRFEEPSKSVIKKVVLIRFYSQFSSLGFGTCTFNFLAACVAPASERALNTIIGFINY